MPLLLNGLMVLVTRPEHQAGPLCQLIEQHGGSAILFPMLQIAEPQDWAPALAMLDRLDRYRLAIFSSANAVAGAMPHIQDRGGIPGHLEVVAIGKATAQALARHGIKANAGLPDRNFTSETLLELPCFQPSRVSGQTILIVRGEGGRRLLSAILSARGAQVDHAEVYRRLRPSVDTTSLVQRCQRGAIGAVIITSGESLLNLFDMFDAAGQDVLRQTPLIVVSARLQRLAAAQGCRCIVLAQEPSDAAILAALLQLDPPFSSTIGNAT